MAINTTHAEVLLQVGRAYYGVLRAAAILKVAEGTVNARQLARISYQLSTAAADPGRKRKPGTLTYFVLVDKR